jgi:hypothetical protein
MFPNKYLSLALMAGTLLQVSAGPTGDAALKDINDGSVSVWKELRAKDRGIALSGYADCARSLPRSVDLAWDDKKQAARIDEKAPSAASLPALLFSMRNDRSVGPPDPHAEHASGTYGFHNGTWWSELDRNQRIAYLRGIAWCSASFKANGADVFTTGDTPALVARLNDWFGVDKEHGEVDVSAPHADMPVFVALRKTGLLKAGRRVVGGPRR